MLAWIRRLLQTAVNAESTETGQSRKIRALYAEARRYPRAYDIPAYLRRARI